MDRCVYTCTSICIYIYIHIYMYSTPTHTQNGCKHAPRTQACTPQQGCLPISLEKRKPRAPREHTPVMELAREVPSLGSGSLCIKGRELSRHPDYQFGGNSQRQEEWIVEGVEKRVLQLYMAVLWKQVRLFQGSSYLEHPINSRRVPRWRFLSPPCRLLYMGLCSFPARHLLQSAFRMYSKATSYEGGPVELTG